MSYLVRNHRYTLEESMATVQSCRDLDHLVEIIRAQEADQPRSPLQDITRERIELKPYGSDRRIGWDKVYLIDIRNADGELWGVWGMANGDLTPTHAKIRQ